jgi:formylglycine-generating enzyme required for sulfatase activity
MQLPARVGKYELEEYLGGGMSHVYRARDTLIGRTVAVKILTDKGREDADVKARFLAEARTAGNISHENILGIYDFGEDEDHHPFMVMEFLRGEDLRSAIKKGHTGDMRNRMRIALEVGRALEYIHGLKIVHRDLKPENVHISLNGQVKLMDFGISKTEGLHLTRTGFMVGTPYYMAPEQVTGSPVTAQADVYSFGVLLYELITGIHAIAGDTMERIFYAILNEPIPVEPMRRAGAPAGLSRLVTACTAKSPTERPQGFGHICRDLEQLMAAPEAGVIDQEAATLVMPERQPAAAGSPAAGSPAMDAPTEAIPLSKQPSAAPAPVAPAPPPAAIPERKKPAWLWPSVGLGIAAAAVVFFVFRPHAPAASIPPAASTGSPTAPAIQTRITTPTGEMMLVPAGPFLFGQKKEQAQLPAFYIDRTEVTNAAYSQFSNATHRQLPPKFPADKPGYPVVNVTVEDARAFASWAGKRLPSAMEWEKAARGADGRLYPWGDTPEKARANVGTDQLQPAEEFAGSASPYGALQMVGNVWEFVDETAKPSVGALAHFRGRLTPAPMAAETWYRIRGESFNDARLDEGAIWDSGIVPARWRDENLGFRCVMDTK